MQSSSRLFPVALVSAELRADLTEDIYRLKPGNSPDASVELVVTRRTAGRRRAARTACDPPAREFSNRRFWYSPRALGLGPYLARAGFDVWLPEMRGHGLSIRNDGYRDNRVADYARYDLPALASFIHEQCGQPAHWIGHSLGGVVLAAGLGGVTWTRRGSLPWRCSVARSAPRTGCSGCPWQASSRACCCAASMRCPEAVGGRGRKTSRSAWRWRSCVGMGCSAASASRATTGGRGSPQSTYRYWRSPGLGTGRTRPGPVASCSSSSPRPSANTCCSDARLATPRTTGISRC
ncbi:alpha/beta hydrolase [Pseudomonas aeruginosa]